MTQRWSTQHLEIPTFSLLKTKTVYTETLTPPRRVEIEKSDRGGMRKLGIPTTLDRFLQQALMPTERWVVRGQSQGFRQNKYFSEN